MSKLKVLVVDDEPDILQVLQSHLTLLEYEVSTAADGAMALKKVEADPPDVILLDYNLPYFDGKTLLKLFKKVAPDSIVIMISGVASEELARECLNFGAFDYLQKPFQLDQVTQMLRAITQFYRPEQ